MTKISIITPCFNAENQIADTVESVLTQTAVLSGRVELEYIIRDGKSTDRTLDIISQVVERCGCQPVRIVSEEDSGMYAALAKGLGEASGDLCSYINAGDCYERHAFDVLLDVVESCRVEWITGISVLCNEKGQVTTVYPPFPYRCRLIRSGFYGKSLPFIQQESTFWKTYLNKQIDFEKLSRFRYAGDYYLWYCFSNSAELKTVESILGSFKIHAGQLSEDMAGYQAEAATITEKPGTYDTLLACYDKILSQFPRKIKNIAGWDKWIVFDQKAERWQDM